MKAISEKSSNRIKELKKKLGTPDGVEKVWTAEGQKMIFDYVNGNDRIYWEAKLEDNKWSFYVAARINKSIDFLNNVVLKGKLLGIDLSSGAKFPDGRHVILIKDLKDSEDAMTTIYDLFLASVNHMNSLYGSPSNFLTDSFINNRKSVSPKLDILWVIDNSGSMSSYQKSLELNFDKFIDKFMKKPVNEIPDFKMAITTTDEGDKGRINDGSGMLDKYHAIDEDLNDMFLAMFILAINVGTSGSATERGIKCSYLAVEKNPIFFREDAMLIINIVTDEEDDDSHSIDDYLSKMNNLKAGQRVIVNVIGLSGFKRYEYAVNKTKGKYLNIKNDFSLLLDDISKQMEEVTSSFALSQVPINSSNIVMKIDGKQSNDFTYTASSNTLKAGKSVAEGASIDIEYEIEEN